MGKKKRAGNAVRDKPIQRSGSVGFVLGSDWGTACMEGYTRLSDNPEVRMAVGRIAQCIVRDEHGVLPVSSVLQGEYGLQGLALSLPAVVDRGGLEEVLEIPLSQEERWALAASAQQMEQAIASLDLPPERKA